MCVCVYVYIFSSEYILCIYAKYWMILDVYAVYVYINPKVNPWVLSLTDLL